MARRHGTDGSLLPSLPWTLAALTFALLANMPFIPIWITVSFLVCSLARYVIEKRRLGLPPAWFRAMLALGCFLGVLGTFGTISGVGPGSSLLAIMASLKLLETRKRRDQFVLLFISIFLVMSSLLRDQYLWSLPYLAGAALLIMTAWLRMTAADSVSARQSFRTTGRLLLYAAPMALAMWVFFPRLSSPFWAVPIDTSRATSGISDTMSPGDISNLSLSDAVAFRVRFDRDIPEPRDRYWRGLVLHSFNGRTWTGREPIPDRTLDERIDYSGAPIDYEVTLEPTSQQWVFALELPAIWSLRQASMSPENTLARTLPIDQRIAYSVTSFTDYTSDLNPTSYSLASYQSLPSDSNRRTVELARQMRANAGNDEAFIRDVLNKFHEEEYYYTLDPPRLGSNPVERFIFDTRPGFCEHYASAFAVMMRAVDIPARIVLGYQGGELNPLGGHLVVRQSDAHAWTEVWLDGLGWRRVDPTAAVAPERVEFGVYDAIFDGIGQSWGFAAPSMWQYRVEMVYDMINAKWDEWVLGYGPENQDRLMNLLGMNNPDWRKMMLTLIAVVVAIVLFVSYLLYLKYRPPRPDKAALLYRRFVTRSGVEPTVGETPIAWLDRAAGNANIPDDKLVTVTSAYLDARYGPAGDVALQRLESEVTNL